MSESSVERANRSELRSRRIVDRARCEVGVRDLLTFCLARIWMVLLIVGAVCTAWYASAGAQPNSPNVADDSIG